MSIVDHFLDDLERGGYWDDQCAVCGQTYANTEPTENPNGYCHQCQVELLCPSCHGGAGEVTAGCHDPDGCGFWKASSGALSSRLPEEIPGHPGFTKRL